MSPLVTKLLLVVLLHEVITERDLKNTGLGIHVISAYTKFQPCQFIETWCRLRSHVYQGLDFLDPAV